MVAWERNRNANAANVELNTKGAPKKMVLGFMLGLACDNVLLELVVRRFGAQIERAAA